MANKFFLTLAFATMATSSFAQFCVWEGGKPVYISQNSTPDSITFSLPNAGGGSEVVDKEGGALSGKFSVSSTSQVVFSQGNLQYNAAASTWRFAEKQYDIVGDGNLSISATYDGWIDLFGWGTSGWAGSGAKYYAPTSISSRNGYDYGPFKNSISYSIVGDYSNADWGVYNSISNGGNAAGIWRTLTADEFEYLFVKRANASSLYGMAQVAGVNGVIVLPDDWVLPVGVVFSAGCSSSDYSAKNTISEEAWQKMENAGAVFFPAAKIRKGTEWLTFSKYPVDGAYWSSTLDNDDQGYSFAMMFGADLVNPKSSSITTSIKAFNYYGFAVRLVRDVK